MQSVNFGRVSFDRIASRSYPALLIAICVFAVHGIASAQAPSSGSPSWASFRHDLAQTGVATTTLPAELELLWEVEIGDQVLATAAIVGNHVFVPCLSGELVCLDKKTGERVWTYKSVEVVPKNSFAPGFKSSPTVTADGVYLGDEDGVFHAIDRSTGAGRWKFTSGGEIYSSAAITNGQVIFGSYDNRLYCLDEKDGSLQWKFETEGYVHCAPAVVDGVTFIAGCDERLRVIDISSGAQKFEMPLQTYLIASPAVVGDTLYVGTYSGEIVAVDWKKQELAWRYTSPEGNQPFHSSAAVTKDVVIAGGRDRFLHAVNRSNGQPLWTFGTRGKIDSSPVVVGNRVFFGSSDGNLYGLQLSSGEQVWKYNVGKPVSAGPAVGEGVMVVGSESRNGKVYCFGKK